MNFIKNNPYRTVGLLVGSTAKEQTRQISRLKMYIEAEQDPQDDFSFPVFGNLHRTIESIEEAASKLNLDNDRINAALFWFWNGNPITDEAALEALKSGDINTAYKIWGKLITRSDKDVKRSWRSVTEKNFSAFHNYSVLNLILENGNIQEAIEASLYFLESDLVHKFVSSIVDETYKTNKKELQLLFLDQIYSDSEVSRKLSLSKFLEILSKQEFVAKQDFLKSLAQRFIDDIEHEIEIAKNKRNVNKANAAKAGQELFTTTSKDLTQLKTILGETDLKYTSIADKVANEILQCGIDYFLHYRDSTTDPSNASMDLFLKAKSLAIGNITKQRCEENTENLQKWIDDKPTREKEARILGDFEMLKNLIDEYEGRSETVSNARQLLASAKPYLNNVKNVLGSTDDLYLGLSSRIASDALGMCVSEINKLIESIYKREAIPTSLFTPISHPMFQSKTYYNEAKLIAILTLIRRVDEAWEVITTIGSMDLREDFKTRYTQNRTSLSNLKKQLEAINTKPRTGSSSGGSGGRGGCYIATMAYGSYEHPQVLELRRFRDEILSKTYAGKIFILVYYFISPKLVLLLKNKRIVNNFIRMLLNQFIKIIKK
ncbi:MAG: hypothetical protein IRZ03_08775 [Acidobacterium ailaaui]|nr:hypothetical protein [Pseudacidobacterium ailaaui]